MLLHQSKQVGVQSSSRSLAHNSPSIINSLVAHQRAVTCHVSTVQAAEAPTLTIAHVAAADVNQYIREGHYEARLVQEQVSICLTCPATTVSCS